MECQPHEAGMAELDFGRHFGPKVEEGGGKKVGREKGDLGKGVENGDGDAVRDMLVGR